MTGSWEELSRVLDKRRGIDMAGGLFINTCKLQRDYTIMGGIAYFRNNDIELICIMQSMRFSFGFHNMLKQCQLFLF